MTRSRTIQVIQYVLLLGVGTLLCWMFFRNLDIKELRETLREGNYFWLIPVGIISLLTYVLRVLRWQMLISATGYHARFSRVLSALSIGYFINLVVPRLGEVTRCLSVKKQEDIPFLQLLGTVIVERVVDIVSLLIVLLVTLLLQFDKITTFVNENIFAPFYNSVVLKVIEGNTMVLAIISLVIIIISAVVIYFRKYIRERSPRVISDFVKGLRDGLKSILRLENKFLFIFYTLMIWVCYFYMTYFWFFVFEETSFLGWGACMSIVSIGTIGRSVPIQGGGMGAYHFLVTHVAMIYGVSAMFGKTLATLIHAGQTVFTLIMGLAGLLIFFIGYWQKKK